jgi:hypothetical protein
MYFYNNLHYTTNIVIFLQKDRIRNGDGMVPVTARGHCPPQADS